MGAIPIHIKIGDVETLRTENWNILPDDRQTQIETIGGKVVQDFGYMGEDYSCSVTLSAADWTILEEYWHNRDYVTVRDTAGKEIPNLRPVVKKYSYVDRFEDYYAVDLEFWRE